MRLLEPGPGIAQRHDAVEDRLSRLRIPGIDCEVAEPLKLKPLPGRRVGKQRLDSRLGRDLQGIRIQLQLDIGCCAGIRRLEQAIIQPDLSGRSMRSGQPVDGPFDLALTAAAASGFGIVAAIDGRNPACCILFDALALDDVGIAQANLAAGFQAKEFARCVLEKSSRSIQISRENGTSRVPSSGRFG